MILVTAASVCLYNAFTSAIGLSFCYSSRIFISHARLKHVTGTVGHSPLNGQQKAHLGSATPAKVR